ncbi:MAG: alpha/beta hydrolase [Lutibacter sp.]
MNEKNKNNNQKIILLSDLWGKEKSDWITYYTTVLEKYFNVKYYDSCDLGNIDKSDYLEEKLHNQFVNGGISRAVESILQKEKEPITVIGFSIGGLIAWKACLSGLKVQNLFAISSTRLRYETLKPSGKIELFYGEVDAYKPDSNWFHKMKIKENLYKNEDHEFYRKEEIAKEICSLIMEQIKPNH